MKLLNILFCVLLIIFLSISLSNFIIKFIFSNCDPHLYFNRDHEFVNQSNISFYQNTFITSYIFSCTNMIVFSFLTMYKLFGKSKYIKVIIFLAASLLCVNLSWLGFEIVIISRVPIDICFLRVTNTIECLFGLSYAGILTTIYCYLLGKQQRHGRLNYRYV